MSMIQTAALAASMVKDRLEESGQIGRTERKEYVCFAESDFQFSGGAAQEIPGKPFGDGDTVTVTWDGTIYTRTAKVFPFTNLAKGFYVGNLFPLGGEDTGEPFALLSTYYYDDGNFIGFIAVDVHNFNGDSTHRIGCSVFSEIIHHINPEYIPEDIPAIDKLVKNRQIGYTEPGEVLTFDGDATDKTVVDLNNIQFVKISDKPLDLTKLVKFEIANDPELAETEGAPPYTEIPKEMCTIESNADGSFVSIGGQIAIVSYRRKVEAMVFDVGVYVLTMRAGGKLIGWVSRIELEETIHPIDRKYVPEDLPAIDKLIKNGQIGHTELKSVPIDIEWVGMQEETNYNLWVQDAYLPFVAGKTYVVTTDSGTYTAVCGMKIVEGTNVLGIGNPNIAYENVEDTGENFFCADVLVEGQNPSLMALDANKGSTFIISELVETIHSMDPKYLPKGGIGYGESHTFKWTYTENTEGLVVVGGGLIKVSSLTPSIKELEGGTVSISGAVNEKVTLTAYGNSPTLMDIGGAIMATDSTMIVYSDNFVLDGATFPEKGIYMPNMEGMDIELSYGSIHPIDQKYLPGVCLPVLELSEETCMAIMADTSGAGVTVTASEEAFFREVLAENVPCVVKASLSGVGALVGTYNVACDANLKPLLFSNLFLFTALVAFGDNGVVFSLSRNT